MERRSTPRRTTAFTVWSRELPGQTAVGVDLSATGMQLQTNGPVEVGDPLMLTLDNDLAIRARACWCREEEGQFLVGVRFERLEPETRRRLELL